MLHIKPQKFNSVLVSADSQEELAQTFMRFQEHYESPNENFRRNIFTRGEYLNWYSKEYGAATYHIDWSGFNFPSSILEPFKQGLFDPLTDQELSLLNLFKYRNDKFYIIGANDDTIIRHELAHALYYHNDNYSQSINQLFNTHKNSIARIAAYIINKGYHKDVLYDELQAYITDNDNEFIIDNTPQDLLNEVNSLYKEYALDN